MKLAAAICVACLSLSAPQFAQCPKLPIFGTPGQLNEAFGVALALSDDLLVAGAPGHTHPLFFQGSAYVYYLDGDQASLGAQLYPSDPLTNGHFGAAVAIDGDTVAVAATGASTIPGAVYVFERTPNGWQQQQKLALSAGGNTAEFGATLALSGDWLFVGAPAYAQSGPERGAVVVYQRSGGSWSQVGLLEPPNPGSYLSFGTSLALDGERLAIGAPGTSPSGTQPPWTDGFAYVYRLTAGSWVFAQSLPAPQPGGPNFHSAFAARVALEAGRLIVGAPAEYNPTSGFLGKLYEYRNLGAGWVQTAVLADPQPSSGSTTGFGYEFALSGEHLFVAIGYSASTGAPAYLFHDSPAGWTLQTKVLPRPSRVALSGARAATSGDAPLGSSYSGQALVFDLDSTGCAPLIGSAGVAGTHVPDSVDFEIDAGLGFAGKPYLLLSSLTGTSPGIAFGSITLPLNPDALLLFGLQNPGSALYTHGFGLLDAQGRAQSSLNLPGNIVFLAGNTLNHAYALLDAAQGLAAVLASNPVATFLTANW